MGTNLILIKANGNRVPIQNRRTATRITSAKQTWALNADDKLNITVESPIAQTYNIGDKLNVFGRDYKLNRLPKVKRTGMHEFSYDLEFEGIQYDLLRVTYDLTIDTTNNKLQDVQGDSLTGDLRRFMSVLISNANRVFPGKWALGACPDTVADKTLTFGEADNCLLVLQNLCGESNFNVEYEIENTDNVYTINLKTKVGQTLPYAFMFGKGRGLYELTRENVSSANIVTRLKVYGSTENITMKYRADRLCLPGKTKAQSYIEKAEAVAKYGIFEGRKDFDVKPTFTGTVSAIVAGNVLQFVDTSFPFDLNEKEPDGVTTKYLIDGLDAKIHFNSGNLAGYDFTVKSYDHATHTFTLNKLTDDRGDVFPSDKSDAFQFAVGNTYKITDIAYSPEIEAQAEEKLAEQGNVYYDQNCQPKVQYGLAVTKQWLESVVDAQDNVIVNVFAPGDYLHIVDAEIDVDKSVRIKSFTRNILDPYDYALTISDLAITTSTTNRVLSELIDIDKVLTINNLKDPIRARANWRASREVLDMVFDPEGDYYTDKIKPNSIDTLALSVGAKSMQFGLANTVFQPNYNGNKNVLKWQGGVLTHYTINEESAMSWVLADGQATLENDSDAFYIYAKCPKVGQDGTIVLTKEQHKVDGDATHYYFWIGVLNSVDAETKVRSIALTYGFTMINGRFIKTGRIESADGTTYFDLDNSEIGGRIVFTSNGEEKTLEQLGAEALESKNYINNTLPGLLSGLVTQIDGKVETWFQAADPSLSWVDADTRMKHVGDMWYNTSTKRLYCYASNASNYYWDEVKSQDALDAYEAASQAQDTADGKRRVFVSQPYPPYDVGDLWVQGSTGDIMRCKNARKTGDYNATDWEKASKYTDDSNFNDFVENIYNIDIAKIKNQLDGVVETHFGDVVPTLNNAPAKEWTTTALKEEHLGDIYYNNTSGVGYRFGKSGNTYSWFEIRDTGVTEALAAAAKAQDTADSKRRVFVTTPYPPYDIGDLWVQGKSGDLMRCKVAKASGGSYSATDWEKATNYTSDENLDAFIDGVFTDTISELTNQIDGKVESWYLTTDPASEWTTNAIRDKHVGDTWYNLTSKTFSIYVKSGSTYSWKKIEDAEAIAAAEAAAKAQDTADGKRRVFTSQPYPPYDVGDLWAQGSTGDIMRCKTARASGNYSASDWEKASKYTDNSALNTFINATYAPTISGMITQIDGKIETWFQTTNPANNWATNAVKAKHVGDMWFDSGNNTLWCYSSSYAWVQIKDQTAIDAYNAASQAQDTADGKRRVFVSQPYPPYDVGDLWVDGTDLRRCITARTSGNYITNDWVVAVKYDNTKTVIDGGLVTSGTIQVAGDNASILAGMTGQGTTAASIRFWAGASFENRATAPFRVQQDGSVVMTKANVTGVINATSGVFKGRVEANEGVFYGSLAIPPQELEDSETPVLLSFEKGFNFTGILSGGTSVKKPIILPTNEKYNGVQCSIINYGLGTNGYFSVSTQNNLPFMYCGRIVNRNTINYIDILGTSEVRLKAIKVSGIIRWFVENTLDFSFDYNGLGLTNGLPNQVVRCLGSYWMTSKYTLQTLMCSDNNPMYLVQAFGGGSWHFKFKKNIPASKNYIVIPRSANVKTSSIPYTITNKSNEGFVINWYYQSSFGESYLDAGDWGFDIIEFDY